MMSLPRHVEHARDERVATLAAGLLGKLCPADQIARHAGHDRDQVRAVLAAQLQHNLADEAAFFQGRAVQVRPDLRSDQQAGDHAFHVDLRAAGRFQLHVDAARLSLAASRSMTSMRQRSFERHRADLLVGAPAADTSTWRRAGASLHALGRTDEPRVDDAHLAGAGLVDVNHGLADDGMPGKRILQVAITAINPIARFD